MNVLLLEDDVILNEILTEHLEEQGFAVTSLFDGEEAYDALVGRLYDFALLDVNAPTLDGFSLLQAVRTMKVQTPCIFITSLNGADDVKKGFDLGADDYLKKPFELVELDARIGHLIRMHGLALQQIDLGHDFVLDLPSRTLLHRNQQTSLPKKEFEFLHYLAMHADRIVSQDELIANIWSESETPGDSTIRTYIKNLRAYLGKDAIISVKGVGYQLDIQ